MVFARRRARGSGRHLTSIPGWSLLFCPVVVDSLQACVSSTEFCYHRLFCQNSLPRLLCNNPSY